MSAISLKSITGITSITTPAGVDNQLTLHNNNTTEAVKLDIAGNLHFHNHLNITGVSTASNFKTGTSNLHNTGLNVQDLDVDGHTNLDNVSVAGVSTFSGNIQLLDNVELNLGTHNDFDIFHNDDDAYIRNAKGALIIRNNGQSGDADASQIYIQATPAENSIQCSPNGPVLLYHDNQIRLSTTAAGVSINRDLDVDGHTNLDNVSVAGVTTITGGTSPFQVVHTGGAGVRITRNSKYLDINANWGGSDTHSAINFGNSMGFALYSSNSEKLRITSGGQVLQGVTSGVPVCSTADARMQVHNNASVLTASFTGYGAHSGGSIIALGKSRSNTIGDATGAVSNGDTLGDIRFGGSDGTDMHNTAAAIRGEVDGSVSSNTLPGRLVFDTNSGSGNIERLRITSTGAVALSGNRDQIAPTAYDDLTGANQAGLLIGSSGITDAGIMLRTSTTGRGRIYFGDNSGSDAGRKQGRIEYYNDGDYMLFATSGSEKLRITSAGLLLGGSDSSNNTTLGGNAGDSIASGGISNTLIGKNAGTAISTGDSNTALGYHALKTISTNGACVAVGSNALEVCTGGDNIGVGFAAGQQLAGGTNNCLIGSSAGLSIQAGTHNVAIGRDALRLGSNSNVSNNVVAGSYSLNQLTNAYNNVVIGYNCSGSATMTGGTSWHSNVVIGYQAGNIVPSTASNIIIGKYTCHEAGSGHSDNIVMGPEAGRYLGNSSNNNIILGQQAAYKAGYGSGSNHAYSWVHSIAIGYRAMYNATGGPDSVVAIGSQALREYNGNGDNTSGGYIVAVGSNCMSSNQHIRHTVAIGNDAGAYWNAAKSAQHEGGCVFIGGGAGRYQGTASSIIAIGRDSLNASNSTPASGTNNTGIGARALEKLTTGSHNVCVSALYGALFVDTGSWNTFMGSLAGYAYDTNNACKSGNYCTQIGGYTRSSGSSNDYENVFGYGGIGKGARTFFVNNDSGVYHAGNISSWSTTSDRRIKKNIINNNTGLDVINSIQVRNFEYKTKGEIINDNPELENVAESAVVEKEGLQLGVIAQELEKVLPDCVKTQSTGIKTVDSDNITWYLINAVKELSAEVKSLKAQLNS